MTRQIVPVALILVLWAFGLCATAQPDLIVAGIASIPLTPIAGTTTTLLATIENVGSQDASQPFYVAFEVDGRQLDVVMVSSGLRAGRSTTATVSWSATAGSHVVRVDVDEPFDRIAERDEANNVQTVMMVAALSDIATAALSPFKVAVVRFEDRSGSPFVNVGEGVADKLIERLLGVGVRVLERSELEAIMRERGLNPSLSGDVSIAGQLLGADLLIVGSVSDVHLRETSLSLGFLSLNSAAVDVSLSARLVSVGTSEILSAFSAEGHDEGSTGFSVNLGQVLSFLQAASSPPCAAGFLTGRPWYNLGESIPFSYENPGATTWLGVEIYNTTGTFLKWLGWEFIDLGTCATWTWNQRNAAGFQMSPGIYTAKLWDGAAYIATVNFQIRPGINLIMPPIDEITVGSQQFNDTVVGSALDQALDRLVASALESMEQAAPALLSRQEVVSGAAPLAPSSERAGQIAAILPDGRLAINIGASAGVTKGDFFEVLRVVNLISDPQTQQILAYDILEAKGEIVVTEVRDLVSYVIPTSDFLAEVGDIARWLAP